MFEKLKMLKIEQIKLMEVDQYWDKYCTDAVPKFGLVLV